LFLVNGGVQILLRKIFGQIEHHRYNFFTAVGMRFNFVTLFGQCCCQFRQFFLQLPCSCTERLRARA
jgi:hypothetical protein